MDKTLFRFKMEAKKRKAREAFDKGVEKVKSGVEWAVENKEIVLPVTLGAIGVAKQVASSRKTHKEEVDRLTRFYDPRAGRYTYTKRIPKGREEAEIDRRFKSGESYREILTDMGLAK